MDFTSPFPHSSPEAIAFSPGSTFFALVVHDPSAAQASERPALAESSKRRHIGFGQQRWCTVVIRASSTLQVVRSWDLEGHITSLQWSEEGRYLLAVSSSYAKSDGSRPGSIEAGSANGVAYVLSLDPSLEANDHSDEGHGWVARIDAGIEGLDAGRWMPGASSDTIVLFANELRASIYSLSDLKVTVVEGVKMGNMISSPMYPGYVGLVRREACKESISIYRCDERRGYRALLEGIAGKVWHPEVSFNTATNDLRGASWSPDGKHIAVWEGSMEYKLVVYSRCGHHRFTFWTGPTSQDPVSSAVASDGTNSGPLQQIRNGLSARPQGVLSASSSMRKSASYATVKAEGSDADLRGSASSKGNGKAASQTTLKKRKSDEEETRIANGGLGIRQVSWCPSSSILAVAGFDEQIRLVDVASGLELCALDLSRTTVSGELSHNRSKTAVPGGRKTSDFIFGRLQVWREPNQIWIEETGKRCIVPMENASLPITIPSTRIDMAVAQPKCGICWMAWNRSGTMLASRNDNMPTAVFIHAFPPAAADAADRTPRPYLMAVLLFGAAVRSAVWQSEAPSTLTVACGGEALYTWSTCLTADGNSIQQEAEAIPIPNDHVRANELKWSPDGCSLLIADSQSFCCAIST